MVHILYESAYGSAQRYAEELANRLGVGITATTLGESTAVPEGTDPIIVVSYVHGPTHPAAAWVSDHTADLQLGQRPVAVVTVGMSLTEFADQRDQVGGILGAREKYVKRFYLPGRMFYSELTNTHRKVMAGVISALKLKPRKSDNDRSMIDAYGQDVDRMDMAAVEPIVEWVHSQAE